ncbi:hypothetical protein T484DRAFT_1754944 [Baffinella frigidus]|nr:hypothetical protein T484DRAFT_1754944 [Cryptophyta sp. CCMP2293]
MTDINMTDEQQLIVYVRTVLCGCERWPASHIDNIAQRYKCGVSSAQDKRMTTWIPSNFVPVMMVGTDVGENVVVNCRTGTTYTMSQTLGIPPLPVDTIVMGNCTVDHDESFRVLLYDGENLPPVTREAAMEQEASPDLSIKSTERYDRLRAFVPRVFHRSDATKGMFVLQWVGYYENACKFLSGEIPVGHKIGGLLSTTDDATTPTRPVRVRVPKLEIKRFRGAE